MIFRGNKTPWLCMDETAQVYRQRLRQRWTLPHLSVKAHLYTALTTLWRQIAGPFKCRTSKHSPFPGLTLWAQQQEGLCPASPLCE